MGVKKWLMKQQWRLTQIRGIWSLFYGTFMLSIAFYGFVPILSEMGPIAPFIFSATLFLIFLVGGYIYDRVLIMWAPSQEVWMERNPYQYVPQPRDRIFWFPFYSILLDVSEEMAISYGLDTSVIDEVREYYAELEQYTAERKEDIDAASKLRESFRAKHSFKDIFNDDTP
ncbi:MAG: hypothetical protein ACFFFC_04485 [Candidatus Thorarchaeota archaeon]